MENNTTVNKTYSLFSGGLGTLIFLVFLTLKILVLSGTLPEANYEWLTWFWVFFPLWIGWAVVIGVVVLFLLVGLILAAVAG